MNCFKLFNVDMSEPFADNECVHPTKKSKKQRYLRNELEEEVNISAKVKSIETLHADSKGHLKHTQDDRGLHLQTVLKGQQL
jgi:hypothetical protein